MIKDVVNEVLLVKERDVMQASVTMLVTRFYEVWWTYISRDYLLEKINITRLYHVLQIGHHRVSELDIHEFNVWTEGALALLSLHLLYFLNFCIKPSTANQKLAVSINVYDDMDYNVDIYLQKNVLPYFLSLQLLPQFHTLIHATIYF